MLFGLIIMFSFWGYLWSVADLFREKSPIDSFLFLDDDKYSLRNILTVLKILFSPQQAVCS